MIANDLALLDQRWDRRSFLESRKSEISSINDSYLLKKGNELIMGSCNKTIVKPYIDRPQEGIVQFCVFQANKRQDRLCNFLYKIFITQKSLDLERLCIKYNKEVYQYYFELRIINQDGNPIESLVELMNFIIKSLQIPTNFFPKCFYFVHLKNNLLRDPINLEEEEKETSFIIVLRFQNEMIYFENYGISRCSSILASILDYCEEKE